MLFLVLPSDNPPKGCPVQAKMVNTILPGELLNEETVMSRYVPIRPATNPTLR
jgi:hypothetical protein